MGQAHVGPPRTQAEYAYKELRRAIVTGVLGPDERVHQVHWASQLNVSVTPVREAIRRLEQDGLVASAPHKGVSVIGLTLRQAEEIYAMRLRIEPLQIERVGRLSDQEAEEAAELVEAMETTADIMDFAEINLDFHRVVMRYDRTWTARVVEMLAMASAPYVSLSLRANPDLIGDSNREHVEMLAAARQGDVSHHVQLELEHLKGTLEGLRTIEAMS